MRRKGQVGGLAGTISVLGVAAIILVLTVVIVQNVDDVSVETNSNNQTILEDYNVPVTIVEDVQTLGTSTSKNQTWLDFDGTNDRVDYSSLPNLNVHNGGLTVCTYINSIDGSWYHGDGTNNNYLKIENNGVFNIEDFGGNIVSGDFGAGFDLGKWNYVCVTFQNETDTIQLYVNGFNQTSVTNTLLQEYRPKYLAQAKSTEWSNGSFDNLQIYNFSIKGTAKAHTVLLDNYRNYKKEQFIPVLMHHRLGSEGNGVDWVNESQLRQELSFLNNTGYQCILDTQYIDWTNNIGTIPDKSVIFTWDDAKTDVYTEALPIMEEFDCPGIVSVPVDLIGTAGFLTWDNLTDMVNTYGWSLASHSENNSAVTSYPYSQLDNLFSSTQQSIFGNTSFLPVTFVHPLNTYNATTLSVCDDYYQICVGGQNYITESNSLYNHKQTNLTDGSFKRIGVSNVTTITDLNEELNFTINFTNQRLIKLQFNENSGTILYDSSNNNNGTITGATWNNDGINNTLTSTDYSFNLGLNQYTITNPELAYSEIEVNYDERSDTDFNNALAGTTSGLGEFGSFLVIIVLAVIISVVLGIILRTTPNR